MMHNTILRLDTSVSMLSPINHLSGLIRHQTMSSSTLRNHICRTELTDYLGRKGEAWCHLQARREVRQGVP